MENARNDRLRRVRIVLIGETGVGKSSAGNLLCPGARFETNDGACSQTDHAALARQEYPEHGIEVEVLDTMGIHDTRYPAEIVRSRITEGIKRLAGGVDFFFLFIKKGRVTDATYVAYKYIFEAILGPQSLRNVWLVITHSDETASDDMAKADWIRTSRSGQAMFNEMAASIGPDRILFIENPPVSANPEREALRQQDRETSKRLLLTVMANNRPERFVIEELERIQRQYDEARAAEERRAVEERERHIENQIKARTEAERAEWRAAQERAQAEHDKRIRELQQEHERQLARFHQEAQHRGGEYVQQRGGWQKWLPLVPVVGTICRAVTGGCVLQ